MTDPTEAQVVARMNSKQRVALHRLKMLWAAGKVKRGEVPPDIAKIFQGVVWDFCEFDPKCETSTADQCETCHKWICKKHQTEHTASHKKG